VSLSLILACVENGKPATFKRALAIEVLGRGAIESSDVLYSVKYIDGGGQVYCNDGDEIHHMSFNHFGGNTFFDRVWELADRVGAVIFWPAPGPSTAVTRAEMFERLPSEFHQEGFEPFVVSSGGELAVAIEESFPPIDRGDDGTE
jgi:hypothetical protein